MNTFYLGSLLANLNSDACAGRRITHSRMIVMLMVVASQWMLLSTGHAQDDEQKERVLQRKQRDESRREAWTRNFDVASYLKEQDANKDGVLAPDEIKQDRTRQFIKRLGITLNKATPVEALVKGFKAKRQKDTDAKRKEFENKLSNLDSFGVDNDSEGVVEFGAEPISAGVESFDDRVTGLRASQFDPKNVARATKLINSFDRDKNGFLDGDEILRITWPQPAPESSDLNRDGRLSLLELAKRFESIATKKRKRDQDFYDDERAQYNDRRTDSPKRKRRKDPERSKKESGKRSSKRSTNDSPQASNSGRRDKPNSDKYLAYVKSAFKKYDANRDGKLDPEELKKTRLLRQAKDDNRDGFIDKQEVAAFISGEQHAASSKPEIKKPTKRSARTSVKDRRLTARNSPRSSSNASAESRDQNKLSGLDRDQDGQIQMHEFANEWTAEKLKQFRDKDKNGDGILSLSEWE